MSLIVLAAWVFVPGAYFQTALEHPVGFVEYATLAWLATSPGYRQWRRHEGGEAEEGSRDGPAGR